MSPTRMRAHPATPTSGKTSCMHASLRSAAKTCSPSQHMHAALPRTSLQLSPASTCRWLRMPQGRRRAVSRAAAHVSAAHSSSARCRRIACTTAASCCARHRVSACERDCRDRRYRPRWADPWNARQVPPTPGRAAERGNAVPAVRATCSCAARRRDARVACRAACSAAGIAQLRAQPPIQKHHGVHRPRGAPGAHAARVWRVSARIAGPRGAVRVAFASRSCRSGH